MKNHSVFCEECRDDVLYNVIDVQLEGSLKGEKYTYSGQKTFCNECGNEIFVNEVIDNNLKSLYDQYREKNDIVSLETILAIPEKYNIGKRPISNLLGWGELTFSRYCEGDIPSKQYSEILKKIFTDPNYYNEILESNKSNLKTDTAYTKSKKAVEELINGNNSKIDLVAKYLINKCQDVTPLMLQKALYYVQGFHFVFCEDFIFTNECQAWVHGPVYKDIYDKYREYKFDPINKPTEFDDSVFSAFEKTVMDSVIKNICCYSGKVLEQFTHLETPWISARAGLGENEPSTKLIPKAEIGEYFVKVKEKYNMINPSDISDYTCKMFERIN